jgi:hypothetical protein
MTTEAASYFYTTANGRNGPVGFDELRALAASGTITRRDKVWCQGMPEWESADRVPGLFADLPPDLQTEAVQSPAIVLRPGAWFTEFVNQCGVMLRRISQHVDRKTVIRMILAVLFALVALELLTGAFEIRTRLGEAAREHVIVSVLAVLLLLGTFFKSRRILVHFFKFVISEDCRPPRSQPRWSAFLLGRAGALAVALVCLVVGLTWNSITKVRAREQWEREWPQREAEIRGKVDNITRNFGFHVGKQIAEASAVTGLYSVARTESEIRFLANEVIKTSPFGPTDLPKWSADRVTAWKDGFVEGYVEYMSQLRRRQSPAW